MPEIDAGAELTTADRVAHGAVPYRDVRYFYGPLGLYALAGAFERLRHELHRPRSPSGWPRRRRSSPPSTPSRAVAATARPPGSPRPSLAAIGFSGTAFNFVLPHTNSATFGLLFLLLSCSPWPASARWLAGRRRRLRRPHAAGVRRDRGGAAAAYVVGLARPHGRRAAREAALALAVPAWPYPASSSASFAAAAGAGRLFTENLWPVDFMRKAGFRSQSSWMPFTLESSSASSAAAWSTAHCWLGSWSACSAGERRATDRGRAPARRRVAGSWRRFSGSFSWCGLRRDGRVLGPAARRSEEETEHLIIGMSWLPVLALCVACWLAVRLLRGGPAPLSGSWPADLALAAAAAALGLRAYDAFTAEGSYAPYYAAPLVLLLGILHERVGLRWPAARTAALACLGAVAAGLAILDESKGGGGRLAAAADQGRRPRRASSPARWRWFTS